MTHRARYPIAFALAIVALCAGTLTAFGRITEAFLVDGPSAALSAALAGGPAAAPGFARAGAADYQRFAAEDSAWRADNARPYTLTEIRARGDGRRTPRQAMQDRVFRYTRQGDRARAISELERWVAANPRDQDALLSLARLLATAGRTDASVARYRQLIALQERSRR